VAALQIELSVRWLFRMMARDHRLGSWLLFGLPLLALGILVIGPFLITLMVSFWEKKGLGMSPAFSLKAYALFFDGPRLRVFLESFWTAASATLLMLPLAYGIAYLAAFRLRPRAARLVLFLFAAPFFVNYIVRTFAWAGILSRQGVVNSTLIHLGLIDQPLDWLLFSDFAVYLGLITAYMPFMIFPIYLSLAAIDRRFLEASWMLGAPPWPTFWRVTLPLSLPGVFAASIFGFVGCFGEVAIPLILGGTGYQLFGNQPYVQTEKYDGDEGNVKHGQQDSAYRYPLIGWKQVY
jgi:ABC-type spermidine/putrescine transport system permease subunit I